MLEWFRQNFFKKPEKRRSDGPPAASAKMANVPTLQEKYKKNYDATHYDNVVNSEPMCAIVNFGDVNDSN